MINKGVERSIKIPINSKSLEGSLFIPVDAKSVVIFAHGSGSSRFSPRNNYVAEVLHKAGFATLLFDLLTKEEDFDFENRFNIRLLTDRLIAVTKWIRDQQTLNGFKIGYFGASTGAAAALDATADSNIDIRAVVSRGGRPDMAERLSEIKAPVLLIVGGLDGEVIGMNEFALEKLAGEKKLEIIPGATHLFEEPGTLEEAARLAAEWFKKYL